MHSRFFLSIMLLSGAALFAGEDAPVPPFKVWKDVASVELKAYKAAAPERYQLDNGIVLFLLEDHELPLIDLQITTRFGDIHEPIERTGLGDATASVMRSGGSEKYPGDKLDQILEDMAASIGVGMGQDSGSASLSTLKEDFDKGLAILVDVLRNPAFPDEKIDLFLSQARTIIAKRNDNPGAIGNREFRKAIYGEKSPWAKFTEYATLNKIDRAAIQDFHRRFFHPNQLIMGVVGDFKKEEMLSKIKGAFGSWPAGAVKLPDVAPISTSKKQKVLYAERPKINQTTVLIGHVLDLRRDGKEYPAIQLLNEILSGGMSARLFTEVRTKKGLAYSVGGHAAVQYNRPGTFSFSVLTRNEQALEALDAVRDELVKIREQGVTEKELTEARESILNSFVFNFDAPSKIINRHMTYELYGYPPDFAEKLLEGIKLVTVEDVNKAAKKFLEPEKAIVLGVGNSANIDPTKAFTTLKNVQALDVTIPMPRTEPMVIDPQREADGKKLLAEALKAAGGIDVFQSIKSVQADVMLTLKGMRLRGSMRAQLPDNARVDVAGPFGAISQIMTKEAAWKASGDSVQELKPIEARKNLRTLVQSDLGLLKVLSAAQEGYNVQVLDLVRDGDRELTGVEIESLSLGRVKIWFDSRTKLMAKLRYVAEGAQKEYEKLFSDHDTFGKMVLARTITDKDPSGPQLIEMGKLEVNPELDAAIFQKPLKATAP